MYKIIKITFTSLDEIAKKLPQKGLIAVSGTLECVISDAPANSDNIEKRSYKKRTVPNVGKWYTKLDDAFLLENYKSMTVLQLAKRLGRAKSSVKNRLYTLKINRPGKDHVTHTPADVLIDTYQKLDEVASNT